MKLTVLLTLIASVMSVSLAFGQVPQAINYQAVIRTDSGIVVPNKAVNIRLSIQDGLTTPPQYVEQHSVTTNQFGLVTLSIGKGLANTGVFNQINWSLGEKFLKTEVDVNRNGSFTIIGTQQFLSVPYALYAEKAGNVVTPSNDNWKITGNAASAGQFIGTTNTQDLRFNTEGSQKMVVKTNGNVGIGTNIPTHRLRVETITDANNPIDRLQMSLHNRSVNNESFAGLGISAGNAGTNTWLEHLSSTYSIYSPTYSDFNDLGYLVSNGNNGLMLLSGSDGLNTKIRFAVGSSNNIPVTRMTLNKTGLGLGTPTPTAQFHNVGTARFEGLNLNNTISNILVADASGNLALRDVSTLSNNAASSWLLNGNTTNSTNYFGTNNSDDLRLYTEGSQKMVVKVNGNVGIGTNAPTHRLRVESNTDVEAPINRLQMSLHNRSTNNESFAGLGISAGNAGTNTWLEHLSSTYSIYSSTYPDFNDLGYLVSNGNNGLILLSGSDGLNTKIRFAVGSSNNVPVTRMTLNKTGLGLGTETPKAKIEVANGDVYVSDATKGIILKSPNGSCWRVTIDNTGNFVRTAITCP